MKEKEAIEKETADAFIELYNLKMGTTFTIKEYSDAPDVRCRDLKGNIFNFEITLTEDREKDIAAILGRSDHRNIEALRKHLGEIKAGRASPLGRISCLQEPDHAIKLGQKEGIATKMIVSRIQPKLNKDYGPNAALVIRDASPVCWDWEYVLHDLKNTLIQKRNPFDKGIWIITFLKNRIYQIL